ncbi:MAG: hypothetical protein DME60_07025 [Verrucomicrobia bacterium]|nr:MAG: hypothetical protein DME60_07025 [Verrucomicrobiota bacterium]
MGEIEQLTKRAEQKQQPAHGFDTCGLLACVAISAFLSVWITLASGSFSPRSVVFLAVLPWLLLRAGGIVTAVLRLPSFFALDFLLGVAVVCVAGMAWKVFVPLSLWLLLIVLLVAVAGIPKLLPHRPRGRLSALGLLSVIVSLVAATGWSQDLILPTKTVKDAIVFKPWSDFFLHATIVARSLGSETLAQVGNYEWKGFPAIFYHYGSYSLPSCLAKVGHVRAYETVVGFWAPFGSFLTGLASYALGRAMWNQGAGLAALMATSLIPDAWLLNLAHPAYGYYWLQHVSPAGLYGVAFAGTALILIIKGARERRRVWIASGAVVGGLVSLFKVQVFAAAFPLLFSFAVVVWPPRRRWQWLVLAGCAAAGIGLLPLTNRFYVGPSVRLDFSGSDWYWKILANLARGTRVERWYQVFSAGQPFPSHLAEAFGLLWVNALGVFAVVAPIVWLFTAWRKTWRVSEGISVAAIVILFLMAFCLGRNGTSDNAYEFMQHPFVWVYWLVGSLAAGRLFLMVAEDRPRLWTRAMVVSIIALIWVPLYYGSGLQRGRWAGADEFSSLRVDRGLIDCAHYIRSQLPANAVAQDSHLDQVLILAGLAERPSFAARLDVWTSASKAFRESPYQEQLRKLESLQQATNIPDLQRSVRETGIRWYVVHPGDPNVWPAEFRDRSSFESDGYAVYDIQRCFDLH